MTYKFILIYKFKEKKGTINESELNGKLGIDKIKSFSRRFG